MAPSIWTRLALSRSASDSLAGWRVQFGDEFEAVRRFLVPCVGERANGYPCPTSGIRLSVRERRGGYVAFPAGENAEDAEDLELSWDDVQAWRLDEGALVAGLCAALGVEAKPGGCGQVGVCRKSGQARPVYACMAGNAADVIAAARAVDGDGTGGCFLTPDRHAGVRELLKQKRVAELVLAESVASDASGFSGDCGEVCSQSVGDMSVRELDRNMQVGFDSVKRERIEDHLRAQEQAVAISEMAEPPDRFLAGINAKLSASERDLFMELVTKIEEDGSKRPRSYEEIGKRLGDVTRQAVGARVKRLLAKHPAMRAYVDASRGSSKAKAFSEHSPTWRRKAGVDEAYGYDAQ